MLHSMTIHNFKYYLHDRKDEGETAEQIARQTGLDAEVLEKDWIDSPAAGVFYEVEFNMAYDDETHEFKVISCSAINII